MAAKVESLNEISLNGVYYPITRPVQSTLASIYPSKVVIGDTSKDSQIRTSIVAWNDWRGGIGIDRMEEGRDINRAWWSTLQLRYKNHLVLGNLANQTDTIGHGLATNGLGTGIATIIDFNDQIYAVWNGDVGQNPKMYVYNNTLNHWWDGRTEDQAIGVHGDDSFGVTNQVTDSVVFTKGTTDYLVLAHHDYSGGGSGYSYSTQPSYYSSSNAAWTNDATDTQYLTTWDDRLFGISNTGQLWYSISPGTEIVDAKLPLPDDYVTGLFVARDAAGEPIIYAATREGLWAHDAANARFHKTEVEFPFHPHGGKGTRRWRDSIYFPSGLGMYRYVNGQNAANLTVMGPDRDDGLPEDNRGTIMMTAGTHNGLLVGVDATTAPEDTGSDSIPYQWITQVNGRGSHVMEPSVGYSSILEYNEQGWQTKWLAGTQGRRVEAMHVSNAYSTVNENYRLWFGFNDYVYYMKLPVDIINPSRISSFEYAASGIHETPWFNAGQSEVDKLALKLKVEVEDASSTSTVVVKYATDYTETYTTLSPTITSSGITTFTFDDASDNPVGKSFRSIKFRLELARGSSGDNPERKTPDVVSMTLEWRKKLEAKWGHQVQVDINKDYKGNTPKDLRSALLSAIESETLVEFTFRDDSGGTRNYYVDVVSATGLEYTGFDERGMSTISLVEP